jgi:hypothetical protein
MDKPVQIVLILGSGRSGTTLLAKMIDSSPDVFYRHEPDATNRNSEIPYLPARQDLDKYIEMASKYLLDLLHQRDPKTCGSQPMFKKSFRGCFGNTAHKSAAMLSKFLSKAKLSIDTPDFTRVGATPIYLIKSVNSLCRAELFLRSNTNLRILHIVRHPSAVRASQLRGIAEGVMKEEIYINPLFDAEMTDSFPFTRDEVMKKTLAQQGAYTWMAQNEFVHKSIGEDERYKLVCYEELCMNFNEQAKSIFEFLNIPWSAQTNEYVSQLLNIESGNDSYFSTHKNLTGSLYTWRNRLPEEDIASIEEMIKLSNIGAKVLEVEKAS